MVRFLEGSEPQMLSRWKQEKKRREEGQCRRGRLVHDGRPTKETDLPTKSTSYIKLRLAQPTPLYVLREQRPGTRRPSGLVKLLHNDNVVLTQVCCYRCSATTATPATTSMYMKGRGRGAGRRRKTSAVFLLGHVHNYFTTSSANSTIVTAASSGGRPWRRRRRGRQ